MLAEFIQDLAAKGRSCFSDLMDHLGEVYYAGLLSAAEYHGAAHQRPQVFQVVVAKNLFISILDIRHLSPI